MRVEFKKAIIPDEIRKLRAFDKKVFPKADLFSTNEWKEYESHWMTVDGVAVGCCAFLRNVDFQDDLRDDELNPPMPGSLYISTTGILPDWRGMGLGKLLKSWEIAYAKHSGFNRIVTNARSRNTTMIAINKEFGFKVLRTTPAYYSGPPDATTVMELEL